MMILYIYICDSFIKSYMYICSFLFINIYIYLYIFVELYIYKFIRFCDIDLNMFLFIYRCHES